MIQLECSNCRATLSIDDAFAGGVCRCQQCGTIQTVPKRGEGTAAAASQKALFKRKARIESALSPYSDGLDRAADEIASSAGMSASELANIGGARRSPGPGESTAGQQTAAAVVSAAPPRANGKPAPSHGASKNPAEAAAAAPRSYVPRPSTSAAVPATLPQGRSSRKPLILMGGIALGLVTVGIAWWLIPASEQKNQETPVSPAAERSPESPVKTAPEAPAVQKVELPATTIEIKPRDASICGLSLEGGSIVYIIDRAGCTESAFRQMTNACLKSVETLGPSRKFQAIVWNNYKDLSFPAKGLAAADAIGVDGARKAIVDTYIGTTDITPILNAAKAAGATDIVLVSATDIDDVSTQNIHEALTGQSIKFHAVAVGKDLTGERARALAAKFSGGFKQVDLDSLN